MSARAHTLGEVLGEKAARRGESEALVTDRVRLDYAKLAEAAWRTAKAMYALGIGRGDQVGVLMGNGAPWLAVFYGAALIGAVTVPVNTRFKAAELAFCLKRADCRAVFLDGRFLGIDFAAMLREVRGELPRLEHAIVVGEQVAAVELAWDAFHALGSRTSEAEARTAADAVRPDDALLIQFTSGTTAYPKGVVLTHDGMLRNAHAAGMRMGVAADDRYFNCRPFFHVGGSTLSALVALVSGACLVTLPTFEPGAALAMMESERCTLTSGNDTIFQMLMGHASFAQRRLRLRGGWAAAGPRTLRNIIDKLGAKHICAAYGLSEASPNVAMSDWRDPEALRVAGLAMPLPGVELRIADPAGGAPLARDAQGEIQVRGWNVMRGYYNDPEASAKAITADGWLRTGDLGTLSIDGRLRMVGRLKDVFRVGGENVAPAEVEEVLLAHPAVATAQVVGVPDARLGEVPCAYVTLRSNARASEQELIAWARARCASFRVPRYLKIVADFESIGMTASGKVQKARLREHAVRELRLA